MLEPKGCISSKKVMFPGFFVCGYCLGLCACGQADRVLLKLSISIRCVLFFFLILMHEPLCFLWEMRFFVGGGFCNYKQQLRGKRRNTVSSIVLVSFWIFS